MYKAFLVPLMLFVTNPLLAQGIEFTKGSLQEILTTAKQQNKLIFVDVYTDWCVPCKGLNEKVFPQPEVGEVFNANFINYKIDAEKGEGISFARKYKVTAYPTLLWIDGKGNLVYRSVGGSKPAELIQKALSAQADFTGPNNLDKLKEQYASRKQDTTFLSMFMAQSAAQGYSFITALDDYLLQQKHIPEKSKEMLVLLLKNRDQIVLTGKAHSILTEQNDYFRSVGTPAQVEMLERITPRVEKATLTHATETRNETMLKAYIALYQQKPELEKRASESELWLDYYLNSGQLDIFRPMALRWLDSTFKHTDITKVFKKDQDYFLDHVKKMHIDTTNTTNKLMVSIMNSGRDVFSGELGSRILRYSQSLIKRTEDKDKILEYATLALKLDSDNPGFLSSYSSLLYQAGKKEEAIRYREQAIALLDHSDKRMGANLMALERMKSGKDLE